MARAGSERPTEKLTAWVTLNELSGWSLASWHRSHEFDTGAVPCECQHGLDVRFYVKQINVFGLAAPLRRRNRTGRKARQANDFFMCIQRVSTHARIRITGWYI